MSALDDPHVLDRGSLVATALLRLLGHEPPDSAEDWRLGCDEHGIDCPPVSSRVLVMNLGLRGDAACVRLPWGRGVEHGTAQRGPEYIYPDCRPNSTVVTAARTSCSGQAKMCIPAVA
ncbi:MAG: TIGR02679 domain-containing protein [Streptosporangiaceae bacterium]